MVPKLPHSQEISWHDPLKIAQNMALDQNYDENWIFLHSGLSKNIKNSKSYLALWPKQQIIIPNFNDLGLAIKESAQQFFGYLSYDLKNELENLPLDADFKIDLPNLWFINFNLVLEFNHDRQTINCFYYEPNYLTRILKIIGRKITKKMDSEIKITNISANFSKKEYLQKVSQIKEKIVNGDLYQANLTRKFYGEINIKNKFALFLKLNKTSPANYSAFLKLGKHYIISSSPELFLKIDNNNRVKSSPIKGSAPRFQDHLKDLKSKRNLRNSKKEIAENLMIVDLVRNDLSRSCKVNSVKVEKLFKINSYKTIHHMSSDIIGVKNDEIENIEVIKNCFPPASMTGTPKIKAMEICSELEKVQRGIYSGAIGLVSKNECNLSVVIRTLIIQDDIFEFQVGGAITYNSNPIQEWQETINKSKGLAKALGLSLVKLKSL